MQPSVILVDSRDKKIGYGSLAETHTGKGKKHRAFVTLLVNSKNEVLLQRRKHRLFDGFWDLTAISHPHVVGKIEESYQEASDRALKKEMNIGHVEVKNVGAFNYFAEDGENCENEYCVVLFGKYDGKFKANPAEVYETRFLAFDDFTRDVLKNPKKYTPWAVLAVKQLKNMKSEKFRPALNKFLNEFEDFRVSYFDKKQKHFKNRKELAGLYADLKEFTKGGKKLRGFLVYLGYLLGKGEMPKKISDEILSVCLSVEILHSFFLIHDDIMDRSDTRRGLLTIHKKHAKGFGEHYGESIAITLGDIAAYESISLITKSKLGANAKLEVLDIVGDTALNTCYGQALDVYGSKMKLIEKEIISIIDYKTVDYSMVMPLTVGLILGGGIKKKVLVKEYGLYSGRAFQIQDDILGVFGTEEEIGKSVVSDMREGKNTLLMFKARELASQDQRQVLGKHWGNINATNKDLEAVRKIIVDCGALSVCEKELEKLTSKAKIAAYKLGQNEEIRQILVELAEFLAKRSN